MMILPQRANGTKCFFGWSRCKRFGSPPFPKGEFHSRKAVPLPDTEARQIPISIFPGRSFMLICNNNQQPEVKECKENPKLINKLFTCRMLDCST